MEKSEFIRPLFTLTTSSEHIGKDILQFAQDNYNKNQGDALIDAENDAQAIACFLQEYMQRYDDSASSQTLRVYTKEIERLLLWCIHVGRINISSLRRDHLMEYQAFLKEPTPKKQWCGPKVARLKKDGTFNEKWRPFVGSLSATSINQIIKILDSFFSYLVQTHYLIGNPLAIDRRRKRRLGKKKEVDNYLEEDEIQAVLAALEDQPVSDTSDVFRCNRARYIVLLLFYTGLRISEAAQHTMGDFRQKDGRWFLKVVGKGKKPRDIPVPDALGEALQVFRKSLNLPPQSSFREKTPLIPRETLTESIGPRRINGILKWAFSLGANRFDPGSQKSSRLRSASAHWFRHSYVTSLLDSGVDLKIAQENAGHSDVSTTMLYRHVENADRHEATRHLALK